MLYVIYSGTNRLLEIQWHVGEPFPVISKNVFLVTEIQADGDELQHLFHGQEISGIPRSNSRVERWFGDDAKFIAGILTSAWPVKGE